VIRATAAMRRLFSVLARTAPTDATILLHGESGSGKEAIAEAVHGASRRAKGPFVIVDGGSIPHDLMASELFGHADKRGLIEAANLGTLFLDQISELPLDLQPQLLRVLDRRQVRHVGETQAVDVDVRVIAATHRDLRAMVKAGEFREDLYYRLAVVTTHVPPLRERKADIPALASWFADKMGRRGFAPSSVLLDALVRHDWPGNVRELRNVVERALSLGDAAVHDLGAGGHASCSGSTDPDVLGLPFKEAKAALVESFERDYLQALLARHRGNISRAAAEAGIDRNYIHRLVKKYGLEVDRG
jgi:DNA-binding NtrC family response regulator